MTIQALLALQLKRCDLAEPIVTGSYTVIFITWGPAVVFTPLHPAICFCFIQVCACGFVCVSMWKRISLFFVCLLNHFTQQCRQHRCFRQLIVCVLVCMTNRNFTICVCAYSTLLSTNVSVCQAHLNLHWCAMCHTNTHANTHMQTHTSFLSLFGKDRHGSSDSQSTFLFLVEA